MRRLGWSDPHRFMHFFAWHELPDFVALKKQGITAFVCAGEMTGVFVARGIHLQKLRIPEDFSLLGMEYVRISQALLPAQTTLVQNYSELAFHALELLEQLIRGRLRPETSPFRTASSNARASAPCKRPARRNRFSGPDRRFFSVPLSGGRVLRPGGAD